MQNEFRTIQLKKGILEKNTEAANLTRKELSENSTTFLNVMSSPGSGKTTFLVNTINTLKDKMKIAVMEADVDSDVDAKTVAKTGAKVVQLHTGGMCHLDAQMTRAGIETLGVDDVDLIVLENIGNLICTASYDTGAHKNIVILSVPEGDDKPLKYPNIFKKVDALVVSKIDTMPMFDFDLEACRSRAEKLNPNIKIFPLSAKTGEGMEDWIKWLQEMV